MLDWGLEDGAWIGDQLRFAHCTLAVSEQRVDHGVADEPGAILGHVARAEIRRAIGYREVTAYLDGELDMSTSQAYRLLAKAVRRPAILPAPAFALRIALGEMADSLLQGQRAVPSRLLDLGYVFRWPELEPAPAKQPTAFERLGSHAAEFKNSGIFLGHSISFLVNIFTKRSIAPQEL